MGEDKPLLVLLLVFGFICLSHQQNNAVNNRPYFLSLTGRGGIDGNLLDRLTREGLLENTPVGTIVGKLSCQDDDAQDVIAGYNVNSQTLYASNDGTVFVNRLLDRENYNTDELIQLLKPIFYCWDNRGETATVEVDITLTDVNDNPPEFVSKPYQTSVDENTPPGTTIYSDVSVRDIDSADNARVNVSCYSDPNNVESVTACEKFGIQTFQQGAGSYRSEIILQGGLDYESRKGYTMTLFAVDLSKDPENPPLTSSVNVLITIGDTQDTPPEFLNVPLTIYVRENVAVGTVVELSVSARDGDQGKPRNVSINITNDPQNLFRLSPSVRSLRDPDVFYSNVIVNSDIDRELLLGTYQFEVEAVELDEQGNPTSARTSATVRVDILDENDNVPSFKQSEYNITLSEIDSNGQSNFQIPNLNIEVTDKDDPSNAQYQVEIAQMTYNTFRVFPEGQVSGNVGVNLLVIDASLLDYDTPAYRKQRVVLEARELSNNASAILRTSTCIVNINLADLNDNSPQFQQSTYQFAIREDATVGRSIATIQATDIDEGMNGQVQYFLSGTGSEQFLIDNSTGYLSLARPLDYETNKVYQILMLARDNGNPSRETSKTLTINVLNVNDEGPVPVRSFYQTYAQETTLELRPDVVVKAVDNESPNSFITYEIIAGNTPDNAFYVDPNTGVLSLTKQLNYDATPDKQGFFQIVIRASDNGSPAQYVNMTVRIDVQDENNNTPRFLQNQYYGTVGELDDPGTSVVTVSAVDADSGENGRIRYTIQSGGREHFSIIETNGYISVSDKAAFDYEDFPEYRMIVYAIDYGSPPKTGTTTVIVDIQDANNKPPSFAQQIYVISISESTPIGTNVLNVTATDLDNSASLRYFIPLDTVQARNSGGTVILSQNAFDYRNAFVVNPGGGSITTNRTLERALAAEVSFNVVVEDDNAANTRQTATTSVLITILGTNVSTIYFTPPRYYFSLTEGKQSGYVITTVAARDPACGNCLVNNYFEVSQTDIKGYLEVDQQTGVVSLSKAIDYEKSADRQLYMEIEARASDGRSARTNVVVEVRDDNDNSPTFRQNNYQFTVSESAQYPFRVGYVKASDADSGSFGRIEYSLSGQGATDFEIIDSGLILVSLTANLDYETTKVYNLLVTAADNPTNATSTVRRQTSVPLQINVGDVNDNRPQFRKIYPFFVVENFAIGQTVGRIIAFDGDEGINGEIFYTMVDPNKLFRITNNGYILTRQSLRDMSPLSPFYVNVTAQDRGTPSLFNETMVEINVRSGQLDDGRPQWSIPRLGEVYYVNENTAEEQFVVQARALAKSNGTEVFFSFNQDNNVTMFKVDRDTGEVTTTGLFDREQKSVYDLILVATDRYNTTLTSYRGLTVRVRDVDDNVPDFTKCPGASLDVPQYVDIPENTPVATIVYRVKACDLDEVVNGVVYRAELDNELCAEQMAASFFNVSSDGNITSTMKLDRETKPFHLVCVRALPSGSRRKRQADTFDRSRMTDTGHIAYVLIRLTDLNDNGPKFLDKNLFEAISSVPVEKAVIRTVAVDPDLPPYDRVRYSIENIVYSEPNFQDLSLPGSFIIGPDTGIVSINFPSYSDFRVPESFFKITIQAEDFSNPELKDTMNLYIYIFEPSQILRVVIDKTPENAKGDVDNLIKDLSGADPSSLYKLQKISYHRIVEDYDVTKTDVCLVVVQNNRVMSIRQGTDTLRREAITDVLNKYGASQPGSCNRSRSSLEKIDWSPLWWCLVALAIFIFICCCILIAAICILFKRYKNYEKTQTTYLVEQ